jgi:hypothetical protein
MKQYECHVGHRFDGDSLAALSDERVESVLWTAVRALQEKGLLRRRMHEGAIGRGMPRMAEAWLEEAVEAERQAGRIRELIETIPPPAVPSRPGRRERKPRARRKTRAAGAARRRAPRNGG